jgi:hypothetical protein
MDIFKAAQELKKSGVPREEAVEVLQEEGFNVDEVQVALDCVYN